MKTFHYKIDMLGYETAGGLLQAENKLQAELAAIQRFEELNSIESSPDDTFSDKIKFYSPLVRERYPCPILDALKAIEADYKNAGCENCGTVSEYLIERARQVIFKAEKGSL